MKLIEVPSLPSREAESNILRIRTLAGTSFGYERSGRYDVFRTATSSPCTVSDQITGMLSKIMMIDHRG